MGATRRHRAGRVPAPRADLHARAACAWAASDRDWFANHPGETVRHRPAAAHEFCQPDRTGCTPAFEVPDLPGTVVEVWVEVRQVTPGFRLRQPYLALHPRGGDGGQPCEVAA